MEDQDRLHDVLRQAADLRVQSARVRAKADRIMARSRQLIIWVGEVHEETGHARPGWRNPGLISAAPSAKAAPRRGEPPGAEDPVGRPPWPRVSARPRPGGRGPLSAGRLPCPGAEGGQSSRSPSCTTASATCPTGWPSAKARALTMARASPILQWRWADTMPAA